MVRPNGTAPDDYNATHIDSSNRFVANLYDSSGASLLISTDNTKGRYVDIRSLSAWHAVGAGQVGPTYYGVHMDAGFASQKPPSGYLPNLPVSDYAGLDIGAGSPPVAPQPTLGLPLPFDPRPQSVGPTSWPRGPHQRHRS